MSADPLAQSVRQLARRLRVGELTAEALLEAAEANHSRWQPQVNAYKLWDHEGARRLARAADGAIRAGIDHGLLQGLPVSVKDLYGVRGMPTFAGRRARFRPDGKPRAALSAACAIRPR